jgi:DNA-binding NarL/FixJ family response regulator
MPGKKINIAIADDHKMIRQSLISILSKDESFQFIFEAENGVDLMSKLTVRQPDVLLLDIKMPILDGINALKFVSEKYPCIRILILSAFFDEAYISQALRYGVNGFLTKSMDVDEIAKAINVAFRNEVYMTNFLSNALLKKYVTQFKKRSGDTVPEFTTEEIKILEYIKLEKTTGEISSALNLSDRSIELKRDKMREKANVKTTSGLLLYAYKRGLIE